MRSFTKSLILSICFSDYGEHGDLGVRCGQITNFDIEDSRLYCLKSTSVTNHSVPSLHHCSSLCLEQDSCMAFAYDSLSGNCSLSTALSTQKSDCGFCSATAGCKIFDVLGSFLSAINLNPLRLCKFCMCCGHQYVLKWIRVTRAGAILATDCGGRKNTLCSIQNEFLTKNWLFYVFKPI